MRKFASLVLFSALVLGVILFALPTHAANDLNKNRDAPKLFVPTRVATPTASNALESITATRPERCEVPALWWYLAQLKTTTKCNKSQREVGTLELTPQLPRSGAMALLVEWRILANGKIKFKCTGPITYFFGTDHLTPHSYSVRTKPGENLVSVNVFVYPYGWLDLARNATSACKPS